MKPIFVILLSFFFVNAHSEGKKHAALPSYSIEKREIDKSLPKKQALIKFHFITPDRSKRKSNITVHFNGRKQILKTDSLGNAALELNSGKCKFHFYAYNYQEITTDSIDIHSQESIEIKVQFEFDHSTRPVRKPVIYLYPLEKTNVQFNLDVKGELTFTYPKYENGWSVIANPDGKIECNKKIYNYLFWEANTDEPLPAALENIGSVVSKDSLLLFMESSLQKMGLNSVEQQDFITYWYPQMMNNENNLIRFVYNNDCNIYANLNITPVPKTVFRVYMLWNNLDNASLKITKLAKQNIPFLKREGFTVIEWGGIELKVKELNLIEN